MQRNDGQERNEPATQKRLDDARKEGRIPRSRELNSFAMLLAASAGLLWLGQDLSRALLDVLRRGLQLDRAQAFSVTAPGESLLHALYASLAAMAPLLLLLCAVALLAPLFVGGWSFSTKACAFKANRLNPVQGLGRIFSAHGAGELAKALLKLALTGAATLWLLWHYAAPILGLGHEPVESAVAHTVQLMAWSLFTVSATLCVVTAADIPLQLWQHAKQLKMTRQEVRDELKQTDGNPEVRGRIRAVQREMARRRMMTEVPKADVIITNPTHYAVALRYDQGRMRAPSVVAKGRGPVAEKIRALGAESGVALLSAPPLARALYYSTELNQEIPAGLYHAVAQVLAYVYQLRKAAREGAVREAAAPDFADMPIPDELRRDAGED
ncbi:MAG: flagellar biosynthesis protein FlhB [Gammaproteobacteria bacterium]|nr:MAG: flagellar biosynthesis protein FlhB [Gammaproteobacteria bacterium]